MEIANPIYDAVFKYLMEDIRAAKVLISHLSGFEIESLEFKPTEHRIDNVGGRNFTVCRMDFAARVKTKQGPKLILIEIQKAKFPTDIMRFRRYLGTQYSNPENCIEITEERNGKEITKKIAEPIFTIYFLGHMIEYNDVPVIKVDRKCIDAATNEELEERSDFVEGLTHNSVIVQIPAIKGNRRTKLEVLLSFFDQDLIIDNANHTLFLNDEEIPEEFQFIYRRLMKANSQPKLKESMNIEDEVIEELGQKERLIARLGERAEKETEARIKAETEKQKEAEARKKAEEEKQKMIELLKAAGISEEDIQAKLKND